jgi:hypothetical protein
MVISVFEVYAGKLIPRHFEIRFSASLLYDLIPALFLVTVQLNSESHHR